MECINCAQCIDACNDVMAKLNRPLNLIRYSSQAHDAGSPRKLIRPRTIIYPLIIAAVFALFALLLAGKGGTELMILRGKGLPYTEFENNLVGNPVDLRVINRSDKPQTYTIMFDNAPSILFRSEHSSFVIPPRKTQTVSGFILAPADSFTQGKLQTKLVLESDMKKVAHGEFILLGPTGPATTTPHTEEPK